MEYASKGDLYEVLSNAGRFTDNEARHYFRQLIVGLEYLHNNQIAHRDLKLENLLVFEKNKIKIGDFGLSSHMKVGKFMETFRGTARYADPEILKKKQYSAMVADIWSCGIILYGMLTGGLPFEDDVLG